ncbi:MAG: hypothetical protein PHI66_04470 [Candidatus Pacebacteria bacterium]|nr:hypothetical protein [Candidatus Paceibacterota bacterium]
MNLKKIKIDKSHLDDLTGKLLRNRRLIFIVVFGALLIYVFNFIYKKTYIETSFIEYSICDDNILMSREGVTLKKITDDIEGRQSAIIAKSKKTFRDPFSFKEIIKEIPTEDVPFFDDGAGEAVVMPDGAEIEDIVE